MSKGAAARLLPWLLLLMALPATALAAGDSSVRTLTHLEHAWLHAAATHNAKALARILAPNFVDVTWRGALRNRAAVLNARTAPTSSTQKLKGLNIRRYGNIAIVNGVNIVTAKDQRWTMRLRFTDVFEHGGGQWRAISAQETPIKSGPSKSGHE
jgi:hypothetical protein